MGRGEEEREGTGEGLLEWGRRNSGGPRMVADAEEVGCVGDARCKLTRGRAAGAVAEPRDDLTVSFDSVEEEEEEEFPS
jgi:hypothetical protein